MTSTLIYRGATYVPTAAKTKRTPQDLIYRGVAHDGMASAATQRTSSAQMSYRGVSYILQADGRVILGAGSAGFAGFGAAIPAE
ncbi:MAG: DUF4278 domain-containing protein [Pseudomonadota bacterium]